MPDVESGYESLPQSLPESRGGLFPVPGAPAARSASPDEILPGPAAAGRDGAFPTPPAAPTEGDGSPERLPRRQFDLVLWVCRIMNTATMISALACLLCFVLSLAMRIDIPMKRFDDHVRQALRTCGIGVCVIVVLIELENTWLASWWPILDAWVPRSAFYAFVALFTYNTTLPEGDDSTEFHRTFALFRLISCSAMLTCALMYACGWVCFLGTLKGVRVRAMADRDNLAAEYAAIEARRQELESLLQH